METIRERQRSRGSDAHQAGEKCAQSKAMMTKTAGQRDDDKEKGTRLTVLWLLRGDRVDSLCWLLCAHQSVGKTLSLYW